MNRNSNSYTFIFASILVIVVALILAFVSQATKSKYELNKKKEKMQSILATIGVDVSRDQAAKVFKNYVNQELSLNAEGVVIDTTAKKTFAIDLHKEIKMDPKKQLYPIYLAKKDGKKFYIIPLFGAGLWDAIWGYISLDSDKNTVGGTIFDHKGETPGLGAQITEKWFQNQFKGKTILKDAAAGFTNNNFVSVRTVKGGAKTSDMHGVDAISGGTKTSDGVTNMIKERLAHYLIYFKKN